jgi:preprotein translocase subunit SecY
LAAVADLTGALGSGTGILLTVMIVYNLYQSIAQQHVEDMNPMMRKFMGGR